MRLQVLSKYAQLEFKHGSAERGRTVFDGILSNYPKRVDVWSVFMDMELKQAEPEPTRRLFERATSLRLSSKKMKFFFGRYNRDHISEIISPKQMEFSSGAYLEIAVDL